MNISAIYGAEDKEHAIKCTIIDSKTLTDGAPVYIAKCDGGTIQATPDMFVYLFTVIITDEDGKNRTHTGYYKTPEAARRAAEKDLQPGEKTQCVVFADVVAVLKNECGERVEIIKNADGTGSGLLEGKALRIFESVEKATALIKSAGWNIESEV